MWVCWSTGGKDNETTIKIELIMMDNGWRKVRKTRCAWVSHSWAVWMPSGTGRQLKGNLLDLVAQKLNKFFSSIVVHSNVLTTGRWSLEEEAIPLSTILLSTAASTMRLSRRVPLSYTNWDEDVSTTFQILKPWSEESCWEAAIVLVLLRMSVPQQFAQEEWRRKIAPLDHSTLNFIWIKLYFNPHLINIYLQFWSFLDFMIFLLIFPRWKFFWLRIPPKCLDAFNFF